MQNSTMDQESMNGIFGIRLSAEPSMSGCRCKDFFTSKIGNIRNGQRQEVGVARFPVLFK